MDYLDNLYRVHAKTIIGQCKEKGRKGVYCDKATSWDCKHCGWCYDVEEKRKENIRAKMKNCS